MMEPNKKQTERAVVMTLSSVLLITPLPGPTVRLTPSSTLVMFCLVPDVSAPLNRDLSDNDLSTLPAGLFDELASLQTL